VSIDPRTIQPPPRPSTFSSLNSAGALFQLVRSGQARTRADLVKQTGLARSTVAQRVEALIGLGLVDVVGDGASTGGRPPKAFAFNSTRGVVCSADLGVSHSQIAVCDLAGTILASDRSELDIDLGPEKVIAWIVDQFDALLAETGHDRSAVLGVGVGVPGPVEFATGTPTKPPIMPGWDGYPVAAKLSETFAGPVLVDNDVNIMALGEHSMRWSDERELMYIKAGTGIGCGIVSRGSILRGHEGAAGDIGHIHVAGFDDVLCHCGNPGCLEALAGGWAMAAELRKQGLDAETSTDVVELALAGSAPAVQLVRRAGRLLGEVLSAAVNLLNPGVIVLGGDFAQTDHHLMAGLREGVYQRSTPLATRDLRITPSDLGLDAGVLGAAVMVLDHVLSAEAIDAAVGAREPAAVVR